MQDVMEDIERLLLSSGKGNKVEKKPTIHTKQEYNWHRSQAILCPLAS